MTDRVRVVQFNHEDHIWRYRRAFDAKDAIGCQLLRNMWKEWAQGDVDQLEREFWAPITKDAVAKRKEVLTNRLRDIESELAWLETVEVAS
jgi:hypothetical protein